MLVGAIATDVCLALLKLAVALRGHLVFHRHPNNFGPARSCVPTTLALGASN